VISPPFLAVAMWTVIFAWVASALLVLAEYQLRARRSAVASSLVAEMSAATAHGQALRPVSRSQFQRLVRAGLPGQVETALAEEVRSHEDERALLAIAGGAGRASITDRVQALQVMVSSRHPEIHATLARALRAADPELAAVALRFLRRLDDEQAVGILIEALAAGVASPSRIAAALDRMTAERGPRLGALLAHANPTVTFWALLLIGRLGASQWAAGARRLLTDSSPMVRRAAVEAVGRLAVPGDRDPVLACLSDPSPVVRLHAARAAAAFPDAITASALVALLSDREWVVRAAARDSLHHLGAAATPAVTQALWLDDEFAANNAAEVLFLNGAALFYVEGLLDNPRHAERLRLVERLVAVSGPQIARAVYDQLEPHRQAELQQLIGGAPAQVRKR
jgi:HEAT repeat protein